MSGCLLICLACKEVLESIFFDLIEVVAVNSYILFGLCAENPGVINRLHQYSHEDVRRNLIQQLAVIPQDAAVRLHKPGPEQKANQLHWLEWQEEQRSGRKWQEEQRNCRRCYTEDYTVFHLFTPF